MRREGVQGVLVGDVPMESWPPEPNEAEPWASFVRARDALHAGRRDEAVAVWRAIASATDVETRHVLQAWHFLRQQGEAPPADIERTVLGVVVQVAMRKATDILACFADGSARYLNFSSAAVVWDRPDASMDQLVANLLSAGQRVADQIGPWEGRRTGFPAPGRARLELLTPGGLRFGEAPFEALAQDALAGPAIQAATALMQELVRRSDPAGRP